MLRSGPLRPAVYSFASLALGLFQTLVHALWMGLGEVAPGFLLRLSGREPWIVMQNHTHRPPLCSMSVDIARQCILRG